ncbi:relaxin receptor 2-like, partial [Hypomesus transpacificus]|uniref:relaxin receptor 2-like n=1 Tax=Hypomesus transpacificus TaxID=137520 RepID=UPI001F07DE02
MKMVKVKTLRVNVWALVLVMHLTESASIAPALVPSRVAAETCPLGQFPCGNVTVCLPQALQCNGHRDCPNGADEENCGDNSGWADIFVQNANPQNPPLPDNCSLQQYPESCNCIMTEVQCVEVNLHEVPQLSVTVTWLSLKSNEISSLSDNVFSKYTKLKIL